MYPCVYRPIPSEIKLRPGNCEVCGAIKIQIDPIILDKYFGNQSLIDIVEGKNYDTVTLKISKEGAVMNTTASMNP